MIFNEATLDTELGKSMSKTRLQRSLGEGWEGCFPSNWFSVQEVRLKILDNRLNFNVCSQLSTSGSMPSTPQTWPEHLRVTFHPRWELLTLPSGLFLTGLAQPCNVWVPRGSRRNQARCKEEAPTGKGQHQNYSCGDCSRQSKTV